MTGYNGQGEFDFEGEPEGRRHATIQERYEAFHRAHPEVMVYMLALARILLRQGYKHYGARPLYERARWHFQIERELGEEFKLNDHYISRYARALMTLHPELEGFFELRQLKAE